MPEDQRKNDAAILALVQQIHAKVEVMHTKLEQHMTEDTSLLANEIKSLMDKAFPNGDPDGHKAAHEAWIRKVEARTEFFKKLTFELSKYGLLGLVGWLALTIWKGILVGPK